MINKYWKFQVDILIHLRVMVKRLKNFGNWWPTPVGNRLISIGVGHKLPKRFIVYWNISRYPLEIFSIDLKQFLAVLINPNQAKLFVPLKCQGGRSQDAIVFATLFCSPLTLNRPRGGRIKTQPVQQLPCSVRQSCNHKNFLYLSFFMFKTTL